MIGDETILLFSIDQHYTVSTNEESGTCPGRGPGHDEWAGAGGIADNRPPQQGVVGVLTYSWCNLVGPAYAVRRLTPQIATTLDPRRASGRRGSNDGLLSGDERLCSGVPG